MEWATLRQTGYRNGLLGSVATVRGVYLAALTTTPTGCPHERNKCEPNFAVRNDGVGGVSAVVLASGERAAELGVEWLARVVSWAVYGIDPLVMGLAPAGALPLAIKCARPDPRTDRRVGSSRGVQCTGARRAP